jgi:precorrin-6Y C5,15-methyltransferase (decarboxylating)
VGIGEDGVAGLGAAARAAIEKAQIVFGGRRHLALAAPLVRGDARPWPTPFERAVQDVLAERGRAVCVLASGDPFQHGIGPLLARRVAPHELAVVPAISAFSWAAARLGWSLANTERLSVHGRSLDLVRPHLHEGAQLLVLTSDGAEPHALAQLLAGSGFGDSQLTVLEALGGPRERIRTARAAEFALDAIDPLNVLGIAVRAAPGARVLARSAGLPDELFEHDGQLTKRELRALALASLAPCRGQLLWDVGAGAGSIAIEWLLADPSLQAIAIEAQPERAARIRRNASHFGVPGLRVVEGRAPAAFEGLPAPHAIFVGGGAADPGLLERAIAALPASGRLVVHAVTLQTEAQLLSRHAALGGELLRIELARAAPLGGLTAWRPALPITQWCWSRP